MIIFEKKVTVYWMKKKKDEYLLKSCLLGENHRIFTDCKTAIAGDENMGDVEMEIEKAY